MIVGLKAANIAVALRDIASLMTRVMINHYSVEPTLVEDVTI